MWYRLWHSFRFDQAYEYDNNNTTLYSIEFARDSGFVASPIRLKNWIVI